MIQDLVAAAASTGDDDAVYELARIAAADPTRLAAHLPELLDRGVLWPPTLFRAADREVVESIVGRVDAGVASSLELNHLLVVLAHTRSELAEAALRRWQETPPTGMDGLSVSSLGYARQGGWTVRPDGSRRELCGPVAYELVMQEVPEVPDGPVCPWCASPLWTVLDLDTGAPEVRQALATPGGPGVYGSPPVSCASTTPRCTPT